MRLTVVILSWNCCDVVRRCVRSVLACGGNGLDLDVIVSDNGSSDGTPQRLRSEFPGITVVENGRNLGFSAGVNRGLTRATTEYVLLLNSDTELNRDATLNLVKALSDNPRAAVAAPRLMHADGNVRSSSRPLPSLEWFLSKLIPWRFFRRWYGLPRYSRQFPDGMEPVSAAYVPGAILLFRRSAMAPLGYFDEDYFFYFEDMDLCKRVLDAGWQILHCPLATVLHHGGVSSRKNYYAVKREFLKSKVIYLAKHHVRERSAAFWACFKVIFFMNLLYDVLHLGIRVLTRPADADRTRGKLRALIDFLRYDYRHAVRFQRERTHGCNNSGLRPVSYVVGANGGTS